MGRCITVTNGVARVQTESGVVEANVSTAVAQGDIVEIENGAARTLTRNRSGKMEWMRRVLDPRRLRGTRMRSRVEAAIREYFLSRDFLETRTPLLVASPGMEPHIRPFKVERTDRYLPTSPEFAMKKLLVGGLPRIFQICPAFRDEPNSTTHHPEFTMLEWYRAYAAYEDIMKDTEELFEFIARKLHGAPVIHYQGREISVAAPWPRLRTRDLFAALGVDLVKDDLRVKCAELGLKAAEEDSWDDLYFRIWLNLIEPKLPESQAVFVTRYPPSQAALSVIDEDPDGSKWAKRFEVYAGGLELGNAFEELTDPEEQRKRFVADMDYREKVYGPEFPRSPIDEEFLGALSEGMPPSGGIAMGVDRMIMLFADETDISFTQWLPSR